MSLSTFFEISTLNFQIMFVAILEKISSNKFKKFKMLELYIS